MKLSWKSPQNSLQPFNANAIDGAACSLRVDVLLHLVTNRPVLQRDDDLVAQEGDGVLQQQEEVKTLNPKP